MNWSSTSLVRVDINGDGVAEMAIRVMTDGPLVAGDFILAAPPSGDCVEVFGTSGNDNIYGSSDNECIFGGAGSDRIEGNGGDDVIAPGAGDDWNLYGGAGADRFQIGAGDGRNYIRDFEDGIDKIKITGGLTFDDLTLDQNSPVERVFLPDGTVIIVAKDSSLGLTEVDFEFDTGGPTYVTISGSSGNDTLTGTELDEEILGFAGNDRIEGGAGDDRIVAGSGQDWNVYGGAGADTFVIAPGDNRIYIRDFEDGVDRIELAGGLSFTDLTITKSGTVKIEYNGGADIVTVVSDNVAGFGADDFL